MSRIEDGGAVERLLDSGPADYVSLRLKNNEWSGSAYIAGEKVTDPAWHRSGLYRHLCHVGTYLSAAESLAEDAISAAAEITHLRAEIDHWKRQAEAAQNNATLFQQDCAFHVAEKARKDEALKEAAEYLDALEADLIRNDADMGIDTEIPPSLIADRCRTALSKPSQAEGGAA